MCVRINESCRSWFPLSSCQGSLTRTFTTALQKILQLLQFCREQEENEGTRRGIRRRKEEAVEAEERKKEKGRYLQVECEGPDKNWRAQAFESTRWMPRR